MTESMKTLAMIKMEKNFRALEKGYPREPYNVETNQTLLTRLAQETIELIEEIEKGNVQQAKLECADISNIIDYLFERLSHGRIT